MIQHSCSIYKGRPTYGSDPSEHLGNTEHRLCESPIGLLPVQIVRIRPQTISGIFTSEQ